MSGTLFKQVGYDLGLLVELVRMGQIGLPDIQRPFVWPNAKVRDLFDSMYRGYPVGYFLFWQNAAGESTRTIGTDGKQKVPDLLIVDGQQRLTSLYAVVKGLPVVRESYESEKIEIAFNPLQGTFEVADAAIRRDKTYIPSISVLWSESTGLFKIVSQYLADLAAVREVSPEEQKRVEEAITRVYNLLKFPFTALELAKEINEEQVAEVFVRINSQGKSLNQADFILTLMSVFWDEGRKQLEDFCRLARRPSSAGASPFNHYIAPDPDQLLRVSVGVGFKRGRLQYVYSILRGKDLETEVFSEERRKQQFEVLKEAQARTLDLQLWHDFFKAIATAGYVSGNMISSNNSLLFTYIFYLLGRTEFNVEERNLRRVIARWFFMASLTGRYTSSPETKLEFDLARFRDVKDAAEFVGVLDSVCEGELTGDYWTTTLPNELATSSPRSPSLFGYIASLVLLDAKTLFSNQPVRSMLDPALKAKRSAVERHHLFPKAYLTKLGITDLRDTNQIANYALIEWGDNSDISGTSPAEYVPAIRKSMPAKNLEKMYHWHGLHPSWETLDYRAFLGDRRERIAQVTKEGYALLASDKKVEGDLDAGLTLEAIIAGGEGTTTEFKATTRVNLHTKQPDPKMELSCLKSIAGFLNSNGGTLVVGVMDDRSLVGIPEADQFPSEDKMSLHLSNLVASRMGAMVMMYVHPRFEDFESGRVMIVDCWRAKTPVFVKDGSAERFYIRAGASTAELPTSKVHEYIGLRFKG
jgi:hypothetical protein